MLNKIIFNPNQLFISVGIDVGADFSWMSIVLPNQQFIGKPYKILHVSFPEGYEHHYRRNDDFCYCKNDFWRIQKNYKRIHCAKNCAKEPFQPNKLRSRKSGRSK